MEKKWCNNFTRFCHYFFEQVQTCLEKVTRWYCLIEASFKQVENCSKLVMKCFIAWLLKQVWTCLYIWRTLLDFFCLYENWIKLFAIVLIKRLRKWHKFCAMWYNGTKKSCVLNSWKFWVLRLKFWVGLYIWSQCTLKRSVYLRNLKNQVNNKVWRKWYQK